MSTGDQFLTALKAAVAPATIKRMTGSASEVKITLSSGKTVSASRAAIKACANSTAMSAYVAKVIA